VRSTPRHSAGRLQLRQTMGRRPNSSASTSPALRSLPLTRQRVASISDKLATAAGRVWKPATPPTSNSPGPATDLLLPGPGTRPAESVAVARLLRELLAYFPPDTAAPCPILNRRCAANQVGAHHRQPGHPRSALAGRLAHSALALSLAHDADYACTSCPISCCATRGRHVRAAGPLPPAPTTRPRRTRCGLGCPPNER